MMMAIRKTIPTRKRKGKPFFARGVGGTGGAGGEGVKGKETQFNPFGFNLIRQPDKN